MRVWEAKIYLARHLGLSIEDVGRMPGHNFMAMLAEVSYQRRLEQYPIMQALGSIMCILSNDKHHRRKPQDFIGPEPKKEDSISMTKLKDYKLVLGDGETYTLAILDVNMMEAVEDEFDKSWSELFVSPRVKVVKSMLWQMMLPNYPAMTKDQVGKLITSSVLPQLVAIINNMKK